MGAMRHKLQHVHFDTSCSMYTAIQVAACTLRMGSRPRAQVVPSKDVVFGVLLVIGENIVKFACARCKLQYVHFV